MGPQTELNSSPPLPRQIWTVSDPDYKERATEMAVSTWRAIQTGDGTFRRVRKCALAYVDTSVTTLKGLDAAEGVVAVGTGIGATLLSGAAVAEPVRTFSAPMTLGVLFALQGMPIFKLARETHRQRKLELRIAEIEQGWFDSPAVDDQDLAEIAIREIFKEARKIDELLKLIVAGCQVLFSPEKCPAETLGVKDFREVTDVEGFRDQMEVYFPRRIAKRGAVPDGAQMPLNVEVASRLARLENFREWLGAYFYGLRSASIELRGEQFLRLEKGIHDAVEVQVSMKGNHGNCAQDFCFGPATDELIKSAVDPRRRQQVELLYKDIVVKARMFETQLAAAPIRDQDEPCENEATPDAASKSADEGIAVSLLIGRAIRQEQTSFNTNRPVQRYGGPLRGLIDSGDSFELEQEMKRVWQGSIGTREVLRALTMCSEHYPKRIKKGLEKLQDLARNLNKAPAQKLSPFANCTEAQTAARYLLKINHYVERQLGHLGMLELAMEVVRERGPHY